MRLRTVPFLPAVAGALFGAIGLTAGTTTTVTIPGLACPEQTFSITSWSIGEGPGGAPLPGAVVTVTKPFDECSPPIFEAAMSRAVFGNATITSTVPSGSTTTVLARWTLSGVRFGAYQLSSPTNTGLPSETFSISYASVGVSDFVPSSAENFSDTTMQFQGSSCTFEVFSWQAGATNNAPPTPGGGTSNFTITKPLDACTPMLLQALTQGTGFTGATLTQGNGSNPTVAQVTLLDGVQLLSYQTGPSVNGYPTETYQIGSTAIVFRYVPKTVVGGWNWKTGTVIY